MSTKTVKWGILACGKIAAKFALALKEAEGSELHAVAARETGRARAFGTEHGADRAYGSYEGLLADPEVDAVYIATIHPHHLEWIIRSLQAGKHVLCEKPFTMNLREAKRAQQVAKERSRLLREAFMYRHHPQTQKVANLVSGGVIGRVRMIEASFAFNSGVNPESRLQDKALGGGGILDVGCYTVSFARLIAGRTQDRLFAEPLELKAVGHIDPQLQTDMWSSAVLRFEGDVVAKCSCGVRVGMDNAARVYGDDGSIMIEKPWFCDGRILVNRRGKETEVIEPMTERHLYAYEIESFTGELSGQPIMADAVAMRFDDTLGNMRALDHWRAEIGLAYEADRVS